MPAHDEESLVLDRVPDLTTPSELPAHARIAAWLEQLIDDGTVVAGERLPSEVQIAARLGVSRMTLRQGLASVEARGLLERRRGRFGGNFVRRPRFDFDLSGLPGFTEQMRRAHVEAGADVVSARTRVPPPEVRTSLKLRRSERVHEVVRVRSADGEPIAMEESYFPAAAFRGMLAFDLTASLYAVMDAEYQRAPISADEIVEPVNATRAQGELLNVKTDTALLLLTRIAYDAQGTAVEFARDVFRPDRTRITLHAQVDRPTITLVEPTGDA